MLFKTKGFIDPKGSRRDFEALGWVRVNRV
jgi:hypothetical protein